MFDGAAVGGASGLGLDAASNSSRLGPGRTASQESLGTAERRAQPGLDVIIFVLCFSQMVEQDLAAAQQAGGETNLQLKRLQQGSGEKERELKEKTAECDALSQQLKDVLQEAEKRRKVRLDVT